MRKALFLFMVFGLVGLMCGCELGTTALSESDISDNYNEEVKKSLKKLISTGNCKECPFVGVDISGKDLKNKDLSRATLNGADLTGANLSHTNLSGATFTVANLTNSSLDLVTNMSGVIFCKTTMPDGTINNSDC